MIDLNLRHAVIRRKVEGIRFSMYTDTDIRSRSVVEITSPNAFDGLGNPLPSGLYDSLLGPVSNSSTSHSNFNTVCSTCGGPYPDCPGHTGHIELCLPTYHPLLFPNLIQCLRMKCFSCHSFRMEKISCQAYAAKLHLLDRGQIKDALQLDQHVSSIINDINTNSSNNTENISCNKQKCTKVNEKKIRGNIVDRVDAYLRNKLQLASTEQVFMGLTSHERSIRREIVKDFITKCNSCKKCGNCGAYNPKVRQEGYSKIFMGLLSDTQERLNKNLRVYIRSATEFEEVNAKNDIDVCSVYKNSELEEVFASLDKKKLTGYNECQPLVMSFTCSSHTKKSDKLMHQLEVEAQVRLIWRNEPLLCSQVFGCSHAKFVSLSYSQMCGNSDNDNVEQNNGWTIFFQRVIPVTPSRFRPPMMLGPMVVEHPQNHYLSKILLFNDKLRTLLANLDDSTNTVTIWNEKGGKFNDTSVMRINQSMIPIKGQTIRTWIDLQTMVNCYADSSKYPIIGNSSNVPNGIRQILEKKEGIFRKHMMGKRVNFACRSVITPDPYIGANEIGIPVYFALNLTYPTPVNALNVVELRRLVIRGAHIHPGAKWVELPNGRGRVDLVRMSKINREALAARLLSGGGIAVVGRHLKDGDMLLMNRQPTLHKPGMMSHYVRILHSPNKTFRLHYANCNTYNADYDGDEMNAHFPQNEIARAESEFITKTDLQYIAPTNGTPLRGLIQDHVDAAVKLTYKDAFLERWEYQQLVVAALTSLSGINMVLRSNAEMLTVPPTILKPRELWTGKQVITAVLQHLRFDNMNNDNFSSPFYPHPSILIHKSNQKQWLPGLSVERKTKTPPSAFGEFNNEHIILILDSELLRGVLDKAAFGDTEFSLVHGVHEAYGPTKSGLLLDALGRLFSAYLQHYAGHSCRMEDLILTTEADLKRKNLVTFTYTMGARAAKAWADSEGGKSEILPLEEQSTHDKPLRPIESIVTSNKIASLLSGQEGVTNVSLLDRYMQSQLNPLASRIIKACLPHGLVVPFPVNTFGLMVTTGAKGSTVNQSQISCALGQQALEGRRVPRLSSGRTLPSFAPYDPNPRADGFVADRFLTGLRPQEYYFHCMAGREGLVDTAVKTSRSGYLQRCLVKHLEELKVCYDYTVRDGEGNVVQFIYGEDGIDPTKAAYLDGSLSTLSYMARNHDALERRYMGLPNGTTDIAAADAKRYELIQHRVCDSDYDSVDGISSSQTPIKNGSFIHVRKLRLGSSWKRGCLYKGWFPAVVNKVNADKHYIDVTYVKDGACVHKIPLKVEFDYAGGNNSIAISKCCSLIRPAVPDPILFDCSEERGNHKIGRSGSCVSEKVATRIHDTLRHNINLQSIMKRMKVSDSKFKCIVAGKYASSLCAPGEAVGCIAAQSIGEPSTQMTLNTFHLAGSCANVTLGIPRLREIIMTASRQIKTPTMTVPLHPFVNTKAAMRLTRSFNRLTLGDLLASHGGIIVNESLHFTGSIWERAYGVRLNLHDKERIYEAFGLSLNDIATTVAKTFMPTLSKLMKKELGRSGQTSVQVLGAESMDHVLNEKYGNMSNKKKKSDDDRDAIGEEDGVTSSRFGHKHEMKGYGEMDDEDMEIFKREEYSDDNILLLQEEKKMIPILGVQMEECRKSNHKEDHEHNPDLGLLGLLNNVAIEQETNSLVLRPLRVDPSECPLLMVELVEEAASYTVIRSKPNIKKAFVTSEKGRGRCLQTEGCSIVELWNLTEVDHNQILSNDIWAIRCAYGVEAARQNIVEQIRGVFVVYGVSVDLRHLSLIADYMTYDGGYKPMSRIGIIDSGSPFLQMSFETTSKFLLDALLNKKEDNLMSPSANIVIGKPIRHGTGAFDCIMNC